MATIYGIIRPIRQKFFQVLDAFDESHAFHDHDQVNGIEIFLALKTARQVCFGIDCRLKLIANRTKKSEIAFADFARKAELIFDQIVDRYQISEFEQFIACKSPRHGHPSCIIV
jgi:hypothetical protein